ncbi:HNH endonuclease [Streptomyces sp. ITFR-6]|uniref:HNH endonuclease n=1 Tax=Streptomyces sp. ITFR-6 TaxID=3075197 RepID=UPI00288C3914|nr:HNH endonuclease [Streptomyces sp. ITFR-6]WNI28612.1 HNH endonuclease [Streptomyces sp. ITFR-6]
MAPTTDGASSKPCSTCGESKHSTDYYKDTRKKDGLYPSCKSCHNSRTATWSLNNRDRVNERSRERYADDPERFRKALRDSREARRDEYRAWARGNYREDPERHRARHRKWYRENVEHARAYSRAYGAAHPETLRENNDRRRARKIAASIVPFTMRELYRQWDEDGMYGCVYCPGPFEHIDHVVPLSRGGEHGIENLVPSCADCNLSKNDADPWEWLHRQFGSQPEGA